MTMQAGPRRIAAVYPERLARGTAEGCHAPPPHDADLPFPRSDVSDRLMTGKPAAPRTLYPSPTSAFFVVTHRGSGLMPQFFPVRARTPSSSAGGGSTFTCEICGHVFGRIGKLESHILVHSGERPFECTVCGRRFRQRGTLTQHERTHYPERAFPCDVCGKTFTRQSILKTHRDKFHPGIPPMIPPSTMQQQHQQVSPPTMVTPMHHHMMTTQAPPQSASNTLTTAAFNGIR
ncbi:C2H2-type domain-containing protein [Plasmodiophora brassicae]